MASIKYRTANVFSQEETKTPNLETIFTQIPTEELGSNIVLLCWKTFGLENQWIFEKYVNLPLYRQTVFL